MRYRAKSFHQIITARTFFYVSRKTPCTFSPSQPTVPHWIAPAVSPGIEQQTHACGEYQSQAGINCGEGQGARGENRRPLRRAAAAILRPRGQNRAVIARRRQFHIFRPKKIANQLDSTCAWRAQRSKWISRTRARGHPKWEAQSVSQSASVWVGVRSRR